MVLVIYGTLILSIISLWFNSKWKKQISLGTFAISIILAFIFNFIGLLGIISIILFGILSYSYFELTKYKNITFISILILSIAYMLHIIPGFNNFNIANKIIISKDALPYSLYFNFDKAVIGFFILFFSNDLIKNFDNIKRNFRKVIFYSFFSILLIILCSYLLGYVRFDPKIPNITIPFLFANLFFTCIPEEIIFRKLIQSKLVNLFSKFSYSNWIGLILASVLFGLAHFAGGIKYIILATLSGLAYGYIYQSTKKIEYAILVHYFLNIIHFFFFTYPVLKSAFYS